MSNGAQRKWRGISERRWAIAAALAVPLVALAGCAAPAGQNEQAGGTGSETTTTARPDPEPTTAQQATVTTDLKAPWSIAFYDETPIVSERDSARVLELAADGTPREIATIDGVTPNGEGGLLGLAVHDDYLYTYFTAEAENKIQRYELRGEPGGLALGPAEEILGGIPAGSIHNGGRIALGPDSMLYATAGDAGVPERAQDRDSLGGKILRLTPEGAVPNDNPFAGSYVYSYGHRNPQGIAWAADGALYESELGQNTWDELNVIEKGGNYGWPEVEGIAGQKGFIDPVQQWAPAEASPSGLAIANDTIYIANLRGERLREVPLSDLSASTERFTKEYGRLRDVVAAPDGSVWILTNNTAGRGTPGEGDDRILQLLPGKE